MMAFVFHVFVEGAKDASPAGVARLAEAMAGHYGLPAADMLARLRSGRFRAKGNCDRATADQYARDLDRLGARCTIEEATPQSSRPTPVPFAAVQPPGPARPATPSLPPRTALPPNPAAPAPGALPPQPAPPAQPAAKPGFSSGLAAAFSGEMPAASLGALEQLESLSLAAVDGSEGSGPVEQPGGFEPPPAAAPAKPPEPAAKAKSAKPARPKDEPLDLFVPPDLAGDELQVELAPDERPARPSAPEVTRPLAPVAAAPLAAAAAPIAAGAPAAAASRRHPLADPRMRLAAGVLIAILLGFVPAHIVAKLREKSAYAAIDHKVEVLQQDATTSEAYAQLDARRAELLDEKYDERRSIAMLALLIWAAAGGGLAYLWFKRMPWERLED